MRSLPRLASLMLGFAMASVPVAPAFAQPRDPTAEPIAVTANDDEVLSPLIVRGEAPARTTTTGSTITMDATTGLLIPSFSLAPETRVPARASGDHRRDAVAGLDVNAGDFAAGSSWIFDPAIGLLVPIREVPPSRPAPRSRVAARPSRGNPRVDTSVAPNAPARFHVDEMTGLMIPDFFASPGPRTAASAPIDEVPF